MCKVHVTMIVCRVRHIYKGTIFEDFRVSSALRGIYHLSFVYFDVLKVIRSCKQCRTIEKNIGLNTSTGCERVNICLAKVGGFSKFCKAQNRKFADFQMRFADPIIFGLKIQLIRKNYPYKWIRL
jgi:hypothetical protein